MDGLEGRNLQEEEKEEESTLSIDQTFVTEKVPQRLLLTSMLRRQPCNKHIQDDNVQRT